MKVYWIFLGLLFSFGFSIAAESLHEKHQMEVTGHACLLYTSDAADE